jgi:hypothetical protein
MGEDVAAAGFIDVEADHLLADRTLRGDWVKAQSAQKLDAQELDAQELDELDDPYRDVPHVASSRTPIKKHLHSTKIMTALPGRRSVRRGLRPIL